MALKVIEVTRVSPAIDSGASCDSVNLPLTFFDLPWLLIHPFQRVIFYRLAQLAPEFFASIIIPKLKLSLSVVLCHYLPLAGHVTWGLQEAKPGVVVSKNDAILLTLAETDSDFSVLSSNGRRPESELRSLVPSLSSSGDFASVVSLQITLFPNHGFCLGISGNHAVLDGKTATMFLKSWAHICKQQHENIAFPSLPEDLTPCYDRSLIKDSTRLDPNMLELVSSFISDEYDDRTLKLPPTRAIGPEIIRVTFELTRENIEKLRERVKNESSQEKPHLSTFALAYAYLWSCAVRARGGDVHRPVAFIFMADFRHRLNPPLPATYFGNCLFPVGCYDRTASVFMGRNGFVTAVEILSDMIKGLDSQRAETIYEAFVEGFKNDRSCTQFGSVAGSPRLGIYGLDFGWGRPVKTEVVSIDQSEAIAVTETRENTGGVELGLCLEKCEMETVISLFANGLK